MSATTRPSSVGDGPACPDQPEHGRTIAVWNVKDQRYWYCPHQEHQGEHRPDGGHDKPNRAFWKAW